MNTLTFRGKNYSVEAIIMLSKLGRIEGLKTAELVDISVNLNAAELLGIKVDNQVFVLSGTINKDKKVQPVKLITKHTLKKALIEPAPKQMHSCTSDFNQSQHDSNPFVRVGLKA